MKKNVFNYLIIATLAVAAAFTSCKKDNNKAELKTFTVTFDSSGGSTVAPTISNEGKIIEPIPPIRVGYIFDGWYKDNTFTNTWSFATDVVTSNTTLYAKWTQVFTVSFDTDGGSAVTAQTIRNGNKVAKPADPTKTIASGLYQGKIDGNYTFNGWYNGETLWDFNNVAITAPVTLKANWSLAGNAVRIESVLSNDIAASFTYVNANSNGGEEYTLLIGTNVTAAAQTLNAANAKLTIIGIGAERIITASNPRLFTINGNNVTSLTLGQNITLKEGGDGIYLVDESDKLVNIQRGNLTMCAGSKITEGSTGAVFVDGINASFKMEGGEITENLHITAAVQINAGGTFEMNGGSITGNTTNGIADLFIDYDCTLRLSGSARIGTLFLYANNATMRSSVTINGNYSGTVTRLHLSGNSRSVSTIALWWTNATVIKNGTVNVISMFNNGIGDFCTNAPPGQSINATHVLNASGVLVLKEN